MVLKYGVIGSGAIGGYYGGKLANAGKDVHFLFHSDYEYVKKNGLQVDSVNGDFHLPNINAYHKTSDMPQCDVVLVALKSTNNYLLKEMLPPLLHKKTLVILIQNGLGLEEDLQKEFPDLYIAAGLAFICSCKLNDGCITHQNLGRINIGSYFCPDSSLLDAVVADFKESGVDAALADYVEARWKKLIWNIPFNGISVVLNTSTDKLVSNPDSELLLRDMMLEVIEVANHFLPEQPIEESYVDAMIGMTKKMPPYSPSMKLDFDFHRPLETYYIYSRPILE
ncbi:MAG: 2-dehydropantoate 2-reductase, partial [Bacteroidaceae bacterium]